jgi:cytochrome bd-type quinol oxidase subunit 2
MDFVGIAVRAIHIISVVVLIGAAVYATHTRSKLLESFRPHIYGAMALLVGTGFYQFLTMTSYPKGYHMWFGIKMLFALHILTVYLLVALGRGDESKQRRWMSGIAFSGVAAIVIAAILRSFSTVH